MANWEGLGDIYLSFDWSVLVLSDYYRFHDQDRSRVDLTLEELSLPVPTHQDYLIKSGDFH